MSNIIGRIVREGINPDNAVMGNLKFRDETSITIVSGALVVPSGQTVITVQAETGTTDILTDITTKVGLVMLRADAGDTITITDNGSDVANKIRTRTGADIILSETGYAMFYRKTTTDAWRAFDIGTVNEDVIGIAMSDETTVLGPASTSVPLATLHAPFDFVITEVQAGLRTAGTGAALITVDIHVAGTTIMSTTKITIDAGEKTSITAATQPALTTTNISKGDLIEFFLDQLDTDNVATGLKAYIAGYKP